MLREINVIKRFFTRKAWKKNHFVFRRKRIFMRIQLSKEYRMKLPSWCTYYTIIYQRILTCHRQGEKNVLTHPGILSYTKKMCY